MENERRQKGLKASLKDFEKVELIEIIIELSKINKRNKEFLDVFLKGSDEIDFDAMINAAKLKIYRFIYGTSLYSNNHLKLRDAKKVISESEKILKEYPQHVADLKLYYVETCNGFTKDFGDISEQFYSSVISTFDDFCKYLGKNPSLYDLFKVRLDELYINSKGIGWGYSDDMGNLFYRLRIEFEKDSLM